MKTTNKLLLAALIIGLITSTYFLLKFSSFIEIHKVELSGIYEERTIVVDSYDHIVALNSIIVTYIESTESKIHIEADTALFQYIATEVRDGKLSLNLDTPLPEAHRALVTVYGNAPSSIKVDKGATFRLSDTLKKDSLHLNIQRGSHISLNANLEHLSCDQWEASNVDISGSTQSMRVYATQGSNFNGREFESTNADVTSRAGAQLHVFVTGSLNVKAYEGGIVNYKGNPQLKETDISKGGRLQKISPSNK